MNIWIERMVKGLRTAVGLLYLAAGAALIFLPYFNLDSAFRYTLGGLLMAYGLFRAFRGIRSTINV